MNHRSFPFSMRFFAFLQKMKATWASLRVFLVSKGRSLSAKALRALKEKREMMRVQMGTFESQRPTFTESELGGMALADAAALFFSPLLTAFLFDPKFADLSSGFLLKMMAVFQLMTMAVFVACGFYRDVRGEVLRSVTVKLKRRKRPTAPLLRTHAPTLSKKAEALLPSDEGSRDETPSDNPHTANAPRAVGLPPQSLTALWAYLIAGNALAYPFGMMIGQLEHFSPITLFLNVFVAYVLLVPQRLLLLRSRKPSPHVSAVSKVFPIFVNEPIKVLLAGSLSKVEAFLNRPKTDSTRRRFEPIAAVTPDRFDFGRYVGDVPIVGDVQGLPELVRAEAKSPSFQCVFLLDDEISSETLCALEVAAQEKGLSLLTLKSTEKTASAL